MGAAEMKAGHTEGYVDRTSAAPWPQLDGVRPETSPALVDDGRRSEDGEGRGGAKSNIPIVWLILLICTLLGFLFVYILAFCVILHFGPFVYITVTMYTLRCLRYLSVCLLLYYQQ